MRIYAEIFNHMVIQRDIYINKLVNRMHNGMVKVITGMRRSGKSYLLFNLFADYLTHQGVDERHLIKVDLESLYNIELRDPLRLLRHIDSLITDDKMHYVMLDEIQLVPQFEEVLNTFLKRGNVDLYVTGSNARLLSKDVVTTFRGRGDEVRVHPLCFAEYYSDCHEMPLDAALQSYMQYGGLPQTKAMSTSSQKEEYLKQLFVNTYIIDVKERYSLNNDEELVEIIDIIASSIGGMTNPQKLQRTFKSIKNSNITSANIKLYLDMLQDAFIIEKAIRYDIKGKKYINTPAKYYFEDLGLRNARLNFRQTEPTHLMENLIYNELRLRGYSVDVGQVTLNTRNEQGVSTRKYLEVDFVCNKGYDRLYVQSVYAMPSQEKMEQELRSLQHIGDSFQKIVIVGGLQPTYRNDDGILIVNLSDFLLSKVSI